jgi:hypothetical protein
MIPCWISFGMGQGRLVSGFQTGSRRCISHPFAAELKSSAEVVLAMINRDTHNIWNFQDVTNRAVVKRLQRDPEGVRRLKDKLASQPDRERDSKSPALPDGRWSVGTTFTNGAGRSCETKPATRLPGPAMTQSR